VNLRLFFAILLSCAIFTGCAETKKEPRAVDPQSMLTAFIDHGKYVDKVDVRHLNLGAGERLPPHMHAVPVVGYVVSGKIQFEVEGEQPRTLSAGDAFFAPANTRVNRFEAVEGPAQAVVTYLMGNQDMKLERE
jgi:quercetin dioxygenase-like cupin family protein